MNLNLKEWAKMIDVERELSELEITAYHESAHIVLAHYLGFFVERLFINTQEVRDRLVTDYELKANIAGRADYEFASSGNYKLHAITSYAGIYGTLVLNPDADPYSLICTDGRGDRELTEIVLKSFDPDNAEVLSECLNDLAWTLCRRSNIKRAIKALAEELMIEKSLGYIRIGEILNPIIRHGMGRESTKKMIEKAFERTFKRIKKDEMAYGF